MGEKIKSLLKFSMTSLLTTVVDFLLFHAIFWILDKGGESRAIVIATYAARVVSSTMCYFLDRKIVFKSDGEKLPQIIRYAIMMIVQSSLSALLVTFINSKWDWNITLNKCFVDTALFFAFYYVQKFWVFRPDKNKEI